MSIVITIPLLLLCKVILGVHNEHQNKKKNVMNSYYKCQNKEKKIMNKIIQPYYNKKNNFCHTCKKL